MTPIYNMGLFGTNCYILETFKSNCILIDAPCQGHKILDKIAELGLTLKLIILTHGHIDHINAAKYLQENTGCQVLISELDAPMLTDSRLSLADRFHVIQNSIDKFETFTDGDIITLEHYDVEVIATPGHTPGSVCLKVDDTLFSGDTLFNGSVGRCDFGSGSFEELLKSVEKLRDKNIDFTVYPGHGEPTTFYDEIKTNPFLGDLR